MVTRKGQVTIPVEYRRKYGIREGSRLIVEEGAGLIILKPIPPLEDLAGVDAGKYDVRMMKEALDKVRGKWR